MRNLHRIVSAAAVTLAGFAAGLQSGPVDAGTLERLKSYGKITLCADRDLLPHSSSAMDPPGFDVEVAHEVARHLELELGFQWVAAFKGHRAIRNLYSGDCDIFMGLPNDKDFLKEAFRLDVTEPYYTGGFAVLLSKDAPSTNLEDYKTKGVAVDIMTVPDFRLFERGFERKLYYGTAKVVEAMKSGEVQAALVPALEAGWLAHTHGELGLRVLDRTEKQYIYPMGFGLRKKEQDLKQAINEALAKIEASGRLKELREKYGVVDLKPEDGSTPEKKAAVEGGSGEKAAPTQVAEAKVDAAAPAAGSAASSLESDFPSDPASIKKGYSLYKQACYKCHGPNGVSGGTRPDVRMFAGDHYEMFAIVQAGIVDRGMPAWNDYLTETEMKQIVVYIKSLPKPE